MDNETECKSYSTESFNSLQIANMANSLSLPCINIRSLRNKFFDFVNFLSSLNCKFDLICITELWIHENEANFFHISNYTFTCASRSSRGGGVGVYEIDLAIIGVETVNPGIDVAIKVDI